MMQIERSKYYRGMKVMGNEVYDILRRCGMSEQMTEHLMMSGSVTELTFNEIICGSPISLDEKMTLISEYIAIYQPDGEVLSNTYKEIGDSLAELNRLHESGICSGMLYLFAEWYDTDVFIEKSSPTGMFSSVESALEYIKNEDRMEQEDASDNDAERTGDWYRLELWVENPTGYMEQRYEYYIVNGHICWFNEMTGVAQDHGNKYYLPKNTKYSSGETDLNLSTPFCYGDIVRIDCRPFGPLFDAMILEDQDQFDCCLPTILFNVPYTDLWRCCSLVHKHLFYDAECRCYHPLLSPLYRLRRLDESEMEKAYARLLKLKELLENNPNKGMKIWENLDPDDMTYERVMEILEKFSKK